MSANTVAVEPPEQFKFTPANRKRGKALIAKYPAGRQASAVVPLLDLAQRQNGGWLPRAAIEYVAALLEMPVIRVWEVATFYTMLNLKPVGRHLVQLCTTTPCWLMGSDAILEACEKTLGIGLGQTTEDGAFTLVEVECLGACANGPMMQVNDDYYEDLDPKSTAAILEALRAGERPAPGSQTGRQASAPAPGPTTLTGLEGTAGES